MDLSRRKKWMTLPLGFQKETQSLVSLEDVGGNTAALKPLKNLTKQQEIDLIVALCQAGAWEDVIYGTEGNISLERGIEEIEAQTPMGKRLLEIYRRAVEMVLEDLEETGEDNA